MGKLAWTKFQDFYLRLGFLKSLVAVLDPGRRSVANEVIARRLEQLLFERATVHGELWRRVVEVSPWAIEEFEGLAAPNARRPKGSIKGTVAEALLLLGACPSQLYAITPGTAYKIVDWGRDVGFLGAGNQISEKGLILRSFLPREQVEQFLRGDPAAWNPFLLSASERLFFLFHLCEVDQLTIEVLVGLAERSPSDSIETATAGEVTCRAFFRLLEGSAKQTSSVDLPRFRRARELASTMARELRLENIGSKLSVLPESRPKSLKVPTKSTRQRLPRQTTKNVDHQSIPRFEQLVDLGLLGKPCGRRADPMTRSEWECRKHWRYEWLNSAESWIAARKRAFDGDGPWERRGFASAALASGLAGTQTAPDTPGLATLTDFVWKGYQRVKRPIGHTPFYSIALAAMIDAAASGYVVEMRALHSIFMAIKKSGLLQETVYFASGNEIDRMFVVIRDDFVEKMAELSPALFSQQ